MSKHNEKRASRFEVKGIGADDLATSATSYQDDVGGNCALCDTAIKHRFLLSFHKAPTVEFFPVGSQCIKDWVKALPDSEGRVAALASIKAAEKEMRKQKKVLSAMLSAGDSDGANLLRIFFRLPESLRSDTDQALGSMGRSVLKFKSFASDKQRNYFAALVRKAAAAHGVNTATATAPTASEPDAPQEAESAPADVCDGDADGLALMVRYRALPASHTHFAPGALADIGGKVEQYRSFASDGQRTFFAKLIDGAELMARYVALPDEAVRADAALFDMGGKLSQYGTFRTDRQRGYFVSLLAKAEALPPPPPSAVAVEVAVEDNPMGDTVGYDHLGYDDDDDDDGDPF